MRLLWRTSNSVARVCGPTLRYLEWSPAMNNSQRIALAVAVVNLALLMVFPPYDYVSLERGNIPTFDGFYYAFGAHPNRLINANRTGWDLWEVMSIPIDCIAYCDNSAAGYPSFAHVPADSICHRSASFRSETKRFNIASAIGERQMLAVHTMSIDGIDHNYKSFGNSIT